MKKLIMTAMLLGGFPATFASTVNWGAASATSVDGSRITSGTMYLLWADKGSTVDLAGALAAEGPYDIDRIKAETGLHELDSFAYDSTAKKVSKSKEKVYPSEVGGPKGVVGLTYDVDFYQVLIGSTERGGRDVVAYTARPTTETIRITLSEEFVNYRPTTYSYASTPEPTSGLLLLVGFAGLMLRRKRTEGG